MDKQEGKVVKLELGKIEDFPNHPSSSLGLWHLFSGEDEGISLQEVVQEVDAEYDAKIEEVKSLETYDAVRMEGSRASWKEVLAVYSVKAATDSENPVETVTVDEEKKELIRTVFGDMNAVDYRKEIESTSDGERIQYLYIQTKGMTAAEAAKKYGFSEQQYEQLGNAGGEKFWRWYGFNERVEWCAIFVSWCANECGYITEDRLPMFSVCDPDIFKARDQWRGRGYMPKAGDLIFFDWLEDGYQDGDPDHVGIVEKAENGRIYTIEGNSSDMCRRKVYPIDEACIYGFAGY